MSVARSAAEFFSDQPAVPFAQILNAARSFGGFCGDFDHALQEEGDPRFPRSAIAHRLQMVVVRLPMLLEIVREVEHWLVQHAAFREQKTDEQSPDTPIAVEKRMDRFELHMRERDLDQ